MKINYLFKAIPFISTLILIVFLNITNKNENTRLKILIWNTPSLSLGTYIAISAGTGFILSYIATSNLSKINQLTNKNKLKYRDDENDERNNEYNEISINKSYDKTLIERDVRDPSPTLNATFRVIGNVNRNNNNNYKNNQYDYSNKFEDEINEPKEDLERDIEIMPNIIDWNDQSYLNW